MPPRHYPALHIEWPAPPGAERAEQLLAALDDEEPTAVEERVSGVAVFFGSTDRRDRALEIVRAFAPDASVTPVSVSDEAWAERSQASLAAIRVGRIVVTPPWARQETPPSDDVIVITIVPSMGFGTGHHASTRLCLTLLQRLDVRGLSVLDVGTGSGVLAIAAWRLGATRVVGIDVDTDALTSARENVDLNGGDPTVEVRVVDLARASDELIGGFDLVLANLTGAMLEQYSHELCSLVASGGSLVVSGFQESEEAAVRRALEAGGAKAIAGHVEEDHWVAIRLTMT
jgi:ribosomal protein L11 methyltransferase